MNFDNIKLNISDYHRHKKFIPKVIEFMANEIDFVVLRNKGNKSIFLKRKWFITIDSDVVNIIEIKSYKQFENLISIAMLSVTDIVPMDNGITDAEKQLLLTQINYSTSPMHFHYNPTSQ